MKRLTHCMAFFVIGQLSGCAFTQMEYAYPLTDGQTLEGRPHVIVGSVRIEPTMSEAEIEEARRVSGDGDELWIGQWVTFATMRSTEKPLSDGAILGDKGALKGTMSMFVHDGINQMPLKNDAYTALEIEPGTHYLRGARFRYLHYCGAGATYYVTDSKRMDTSAPRCANMFTKTILYKDAIGDIIVENDESNQSTYIGEIVLKHRDGEVYDIEIDDKFDEAQQWFGENFDGNTLVKKLSIFERKNSTKN